MLACLSISYILFLNLSSGVLFLLPGGLPLPLLMKNELYGYDWFFYYEELKISKFSSSGSSSVFCDTLCYYFFFALGV